MLTAAGIVFLLYYLVIWLYVGRWDSTFSRVWLFMGSGCIVYGRVCVYMPEWFGICAAAAGITSCAAVFLILFRMSKIIRQKEEPGLQYLIVLGAKVDHRRITISLRMRLEKAAAYLKKNPETVAVVSGGQGKGEDITEAEAMKEYLLGRGISKERILCEGRSSSTEENMRFSLALIPRAGKEKTGVVTNSFHLYRAWLLGRRAGFERLYPVCAKSEPVLFLNYLLREVFAVLVLFAKGIQTGH